MSHHEFMEALSGKTFASCDFEHVIIMHLEINLSTKK